jgi:asparagine synthase (glutamine-hydrolysing)
VRGVRKLPPGHLLVAEAGAIAVKPYWSVPSGPPRQRPLGEEIDEFRHLFRDAVRLQMRSDVPYGAFLSGGIDSSAVVGTMAGLVREPVKAFSIGFEGSRYYDELPYAREVAARFGADHQEFVVAPGMFDLLEGVAHYFDEPFADAALLPTFLLARLSRAKVTVVLTGDGGDELFAGYDRYRSEVLAEWAARLPPVVRRRLLPAVLRAYRGPARWRLSDVVRQMRKKVALLDLPGPARYASHFETFDRERWDRLAGPALRAAGPAGIADRFGAMFAQAESAEFVTKRMHLDVRTWLPDQMLTKVDRATMAHGLEARLPFLDHRVVEFAMGLPDRAKFSLRTPKRFLRRAFADLLPPTILRRRKHGFEVPIGEWLRGPLRGLAHSVLDRAALERHGLFDAAFVSQILHEHEAGITNWSREIFGLLVFQLWYDRWMVQGPPFSVRREG